MRSSRPSTERRASGFTLLEVMIAATIFSIVLLVALSQIDESGKAARAATIQADLRRTGERVLNSIVTDLRSTQSVYTGASLDATGYSCAVDFAKITGFDVTNSPQTPMLEGNTIAPYNVIGATTVIYRYMQPRDTCASLGGGNKKNGYLMFSKQAKSLYTASIGVASFTTLSQELALPYDPATNSAGDPDWPGWPTQRVTGFQVSLVSGATLPGLIATPPTTIAGAITTGSLFATGPFLDAPQALNIKLVLKRLVGLDNAGLKGQYAFTTVETIVSLRPDENY